jgi:hypothetical protein
MTLKIDLLKQSYPDRWDGLLAPLIGLLGSALNPVTPADLAAIVGASEEELAWALQLLGDQIVGSDHAGYRLKEKIDRQFLPLEQLLENKNYIFAKRQVDPAGLSANLLGACRAIVAAGTNYQEAVALLPKLWRYSLLRAQINGCGEYYPDALFIAMLDAGRFEETFEIVQGIPDPAQKIRLLPILADHISQIDGRQDQARRFILAARKLWQSFPIDAQGAFLFTYFNQVDQLDPDQQPIPIIPILLIPQIAKLDPNDTPLKLLLIYQQLILNYYFQIAKQPELAERQLASLLALPRESYSPDQRDTISMVQAAGLIQAHRYEAALELIKLIEEPEARFITSLQLLERLAKDNQLEMALSIIESFPEEAVRDRGLSVLSEHYQGGIEASEAIISRISDPEIAERATGSLCQRLARQGDYQAAFSRFETITTPWVRNWVASVLMEIFANNQQDQLVEQLISSEPEPATRAELQLKASIGLAHNQRFADAYLTAKSIPAEWLQNSAFTELALAYGKADRLSDADTALAEISDNLVRDQAVKSLVSQLAQTGRFPEAEAYVEAISHDQLRIEAYQSIASALASVGKLAQARSVIERFATDKDQIWALSSLVTALIAVDEFAIAQTVAQELANERGRATVLGSLAQSLTVKGHFEDAKTICAQISVEWIRNEALRVLGTRLAYNQRLEEASEVASLITKEKIQAEVLGDILEQFALQERFEQAYQTARKPASRDLQDWLLGRLVRHLAEKGLFGQAREIADQIGLDWIKQEALEFSGPNQAPSSYGEPSSAAQEPESVDQSPTDGSFESFIQFIETLSDPSQQAEQLKACFRQALDRQQLEQIQNLSERLVVEPERDQIYRQLVQAFADLGHYQEARELAESIHDQREQTWALGALGMSLLQAGQLAAAEDLAKQIENQTERSSLLRNLALAFIKRGDYQKAASLTATISDRWSQNEAYKALVIAYALAGAYDHAYQLLNSKLTWPESRIETLQLLSSSLEESNAWEALLHLIQSIWMENNSYSMQTRLLRLAQGLIRRHPHIALPIAEGFGWSNRYVEQSLL